MTKILIDIDDVKLALEALENSVDLVSNDAREAEKMYANVPTRLARVQGLVALEVAHEQAITALQNLLTNNALDRKAENARELGLDYEPEQKRPQNCGTGYCSCIECVMEPRNQEPVAYQYQSKDGVWRDFISQSHYEATVEDGSWPIRALYTSPQPAQRTWVGLTTKEIREWWASENGLEDCLMAKLDDFEQVARAIETKLKEKNT